MFANQGWEFEAETRAVFKPDGGVVMAGDDDGVWGKIGWKRFVAVVEKEAGLIVVFDEGGSGMEGAVIVIPDNGDEVVDLGLEAGEQGECFLDV